MSRTAVVQADLSWEQARIYLQVSLGHTEESAALIMEELRRAFAHWSDPAHLRLVVEWHDDARTPAVRKE